ncbi:MAG: pyridoxine 5'-phosphate synthase [Candidatus Omnitrophica bacterium]|nr:pyridoxine 5'-phosphate synthase [Candidatus Omnitrophota bacterium]MBU1923472.1 pyridoxine 5'-phosphate synthase [Candidatus Omnitrophota bacterium]
MPKLGVNIDHVATLRQARQGNLPDPVYAAFLCEEAGADSIVAHLREDRRHIQDGDIKQLRKNVKTRLNLEMSIVPEIVKIACKIKPYQVTLVPERRKELTTEGGLNVADNLRKISASLLKLRESGIRVSLFIDPDKKQIDSACKIGAKIIELHTGRYADAKGIGQKEESFSEMQWAVNYANLQGLIVNAGHGLDYANVRQIAALNGIEELNIGYSIICKALYVGLYKAVREMQRLIK